eukprot:15330176-Ditylum_brightwellii.AAC.1
MVEGGNQSVAGGFFVSKSKTVVGKLDKWTHTQVGGVEVEGMDVAGMDVEADVGKAEKCVGAISISSTVLAVSEEEKEGNGDEVELALPFAFGAVKMRWVTLVVKAELLLETKIDGAQVFQAWVMGPHTSKDLTHLAKILLNGSFFDWAALGHKCACADLVGKELKERDRVKDSVQGSRCAKPCTEGVPVVPGSGVHGSLA